MALYNKFGEELNMNKFYESDVAGNRSEDFREGKKVVKSILYEDGNGTILKVFTTNDVGKKIIGDDVFNTKTFKAIKEINNPSIVKLYDYYYNSDLGHEIDAYSMEKVNAKKIDLISEDKAILLCHLDDLQKLANELANKGIRMQDPNGANLLFSNKGPVVVDLDYYFKHSIYSKNELRIWNKTMVLYYFYNYITNNYVILYRNVEKETDNLNDINGIFAMRINKNTDIVKELDNNISDNSIAHQLKLKRTKF